MPHSKKEEILKRIARMADVSPDKVEAVLHAYLSIALENSQAHRSSQSKTPFVEVGKSLGEAIERMQVVKAQSPENMRQSIATNLESLIRGVNRGGLVPPKTLESMVVKAKTPSLRRKHVRKPTRGSIFIDMQDALKKLSIDISRLKDQKRSSTEGAV